MGLIEYEGERYEFHGIDPTPRDYMALQSALIGADFTNCRSVKDVTAIEDEISKLPPGEEHPEQSFYEVVRMWLALRSAGIKVRLDEMVDWPLTKYHEIRVITDDEPEDEPQGKAPRPSGSAAVSAAGRKVAKKK